MNDRLQQVIDILNKAIDDPSDGELFRQSVNDAVWIMNIGLSDIRAEFGISRSTLRGWMDGMTAPNYAVRSSVYDYFLGRAHQLSERQHG
jgi:AraC-like DNA-binding protein